MSEVRVRFAPSPTGFFHIGSARTALFNWLYAKHTGGKFVLRIEDTDKERNTEEALKVLLEGMRWLGLDWDEGPEVGGDYGPYFQSERQSIYDSYLKILKDKDRVYEKDGALWFRLEGERYTEYDEFHKAEVEKVKNAPVTIEDAVRGQVERTEDRDFVIVRSNGEPVFHFVNVVDDIAMGISHVIRGEEWLPSAPLHVLLYRAFGWDHPTFAHLPLILKPTGHGKLSKRDGDAGGFPVFPLDWTDPKSGTTWPGYREQGFAPEAFTNMLLMLGWNPGDEREIFSIAEAAEEFSLNRVVKSGARFNPDKAKWFQEQHLRNAGANNHVKALAELAKAQGVDWNEDQCKAVLDMMLERVTFLDDILSHRWLFEPPIVFNTKLVRKKWKEETAGYIHELANMLDGLDSFSSTNVESTFKRFLDTRELGFGQVLLPFRIALTGEGGGPSMFDFAAFLGKEDTLNRLNRGVGAVLALKASEEK